MDDRGDASNGNENGGILPDGNAVPASLLPDDIKNLILEVPPTEPDDAHLPERLPAQLRDMGRPLALRLEAVKLNIAHSIAGMLARERANGVYFHFAPLIFGLGVSVYFTARAEPLLWVLLASAVVPAIGAMTFRHHGPLWLTLCAVALFFGGMSAGKIRTERIDTNSLVEQITTEISGTIIEVTRNQRGSPRYLVRPDKIKGIPPDNLPEYVRISSTSKKTIGRPGEKISGLARLRPISGPAYPGSFDFSFNSWFNGLGGSGFFMGKAKFAPADMASGKGLNLSDRLMININQLRFEISTRIRRALPGESGDVAVALIVGDRTGIDKSTQESLRRSGLAHVLAISGMHMALVSLTMIWAFRFVLALNMRLAVTQPIKTWAAIAGFIVASSYLAISGMGVATQRAWIMISVMLLAVIINRKAITLRGVAIAAMVIMVLQPESVLSPGFQMSFAAVAAIVAAYEWLDGRKKAHPGGLRTNRLVRFFGSLLFTSLVAGLATSLFAAYHFQRVAPFGVLTNLLAMPVVSTLVMPMALVSMLAMPYGFEQIALAPMGAGISQVIKISDYVNTLGGGGVTGRLGSQVLPLALVGMFLLTMLKTRLRLSGVVVLSAIVYFWQAGPMPDVLVSEGGRTIGVKNTEDRLVLLYPRRNKFISGIWLRAYSGDTAGEAQKSETCDKEMCTAATVQGARVYVVYDPDLLPLACERADVLLAPRLRWVNCRGRKPALIVKRGEFEEFGAHGIFLKAQIAGGEKFSVTVQRAVAASNRPWNRHRTGRAVFLQD